MKRHLFILLALLISTRAFSQNADPQWTTILNGTPATYETQLIASSEESIMVHLQVPGFYATTVTTPNGEAQVISVPKAASTAQAGEPNVPMIGIPVIIGNQARMAIRVIDAKYRDFADIDVAPSKGDFPRTVDPASVPYTYGECYSKDAFFPASNVGLYDPYILRDYRGQNMVVYPFAYNPVTKTLRVYYDMTVEMYKVDDNGTNTLEPRRRNVAKTDPDFKSVYGRHFLNYQATQSRYTPVDEEGDLLIICYDQFISAMTDFVNWKRTRGVNTTIVGSSTAGSSYEAIKNYIQNQYNANNNLTHVLLVGDVSQIPGYPYSGGGNDYSGLGDNAYGQIVGNDIYNDVFIGRFSASTTARVQTQANRVITYERDLTSSATWLQKAEGISRKEGEPGHDGEDDYQHMDNIRTDLLHYGYNPVYQRYANLSGYVGSASIISSDINSGVGIINYANHGQETAWGYNSSDYIYYANSHVNALTNENKLPFIFSVACLVGKYDHSSDCFAEAWMNATNNNNPTGAIGAIMSYIEQPWYPPMWAQDEFIDILVESYGYNIKHTWGGAAINGLMGIFDHYSTSSSEAVGTYQAWILYGDPSLMLRTKTPQSMTATHAGTVASLASSYVVNVSNGDGALATITDASHNILGKATVSNGTATISLNSTLTVGQELTLCVFGFNKVTYLGTITVEQGWEGDGTAQNPYLIKTTDDLDLLAECVNNGKSDFSGQHFKLNNNIEYTYDGNTQNNFTAIGTLDCPFKGSFNGNKMSVSGIRINDSYGYYKGLFGHVEGAHIYDVTMNDADITASDRAGGIVGWNENGNVENCQASASVAIHTTNGSVSYHGGIVGYNYGNEAQVSGCVSAAVLTVASGLTQCQHYGAIAGENYQGTLRNNLAVGAVVPTLTNSYYGAITGENSGYGVLEHNYYTACSVAGDENATDVGSRADDVADSDGAVSALRDNADNTYAIGLLAAIPESFGTYKVSLANRTLYKDDYWNTLCLPFDVTLSGSTLAGATLQTFSNASFNDGTLTLEFSSANTITAGTPYLIKWADGDHLVNPVFNVASVDNTMHNASFALTIPSVAEAGIAFVGTYGYQKFTEENRSILFVGDNSTLYFPLTNASIGALRAYFVLNGIRAGNRSSTVRSFVLNFGDGEQTGITDQPILNSQFSNLNSEWYTLDGRRLNGRPTAKGLYIHNGKKELIK